MRNAIELIRPIRFAGTRGWETIVLPGSIVMTGVNMLHVPYRGAALALTDLIGGVVPERLVE
jgi:tripartite-type tricarboxylate transporter receptor subunit TctC